MVDRPKQLRGSHPFSDEDLARAALLQQDLEDLGLPEDAALVGRLIAELERRGAARPSSAAAAAGESA